MHPDRRQPCKPRVPLNRPENHLLAAHLRPPALDRFARARPSREGSTCGDRFGDRCAVASRPYVVPFSERPGDRAPRGYADIVRALRRPGRWPSSFRMTKDFVHDVCNRWGRIDHGARARDVFLGPMQSHDEIAYRLLRAPLVVRSLVEPPVQGVEIDVEAKT